MENLILEHRKSVIANIQKSFEGDIEKAHVAGDTKVVNGKTLVYTEYAPNKFDWRVVEKKDKSKKNEDEEKSDFDKKYEKLSSGAKKEVNSVIKNVLDKVGKSGVNPEDVRLEKNDNGSWRLKRLDGRVISNISKHFISEKNARLIGWYI